MSKNVKVHFLTAYVEYLFDNGIRSEEYYLGDASRFMRYLLANATEEDVQRYIRDAGRSPSYQDRLEKTLKRFFLFASERLAVDLPHLLQTQKKLDKHSSQLEQSSSCVSSGRGDTI